MANSFFDWINRTLSQRFVFADTVRSGDANNALDLVTQGFEKLPNPYNINAGMANYSVDTGGINAYVVAMSSQITSYVEGLEVVFKALNTCTGPCTLTVGALGAKSMTQPNGTALAAGDIIAGQIVTARYDGSGFQIFTSVAADRAVASAAAIAAVAAQVAAELVYDNFDDRYLGPKATDPTVDNDGNALITGALYFNTTISQMRVRTAAATWIAGSDPQAVQLQQYVACTATGASPTFAVVTSPIVALTTNQRLRVKFPGVSAGVAATLNKDGGGAVGIKQYDSTGAKIDPTIAANQLADLEYDGTNWVILNPTPPSNAGEVCWFAGNTLQPGFLKANGANVTRSVYAALFASLVKSSTVTISNATPAVVTWNGHGRSANDPVKFTTTGGLPTGLSAGTTYFIMSTGLTTNTFQVSATAGGVAINTSSAGSGVHTAIHAPYGDGDGSTNFTLPDMRGEFPRGWDDSRGVDALRTIGSAQTHALQTHTHTASLSVSVTNQLSTGAVASGGSWGQYAGPGFSNDTNGTALSGSASGTSANNSGNTATETRPRSVALMACIRY